MKSCYLKFAGLPAAIIDKTYTTVGIGPGYDIALPGAYRRVLFSLHREEKKVSVIPGEEKLRINGRSVSAPTDLSPCDRIEFRDGACVFLDELGASGEKSASDEQSAGLSVLSEMAMELDSGRALEPALNLALRAIMEKAGAESGSLLTESEQDAGWNLLVTHEGNDNGSIRRRDLISSTIVEEAIRKRAPIHVESMVGHPWQEQASIMEARLYSIACLPLMAGGRVFGILYLSTRTPGKSIRADLLPGLSVAATQVALLLAARAELLRVKSENQQLRRVGKPSSANFVFDESNPGSKMTAVHARIEKLANSDLAILVRGETGTGKELIAREIHNRSERAKGPFVAINCAAIPPSLIESTLFGYVKGAFTGALKDSAGKFVQANGGTLFLDEIGDLPIELQAKLLRVLQEKEVEAVGSDRPRKVDFRVVSATHQDLETAVAEGKFRKDLYFRLNGATITLPALRERGNEIVLLATHFLELKDSSLKFETGALEKLRHHPWPGNVRELEQVVARAVALSTGAAVTAIDLELEGGEAPSEDQSIQFSTYENLRDAQNAFTQDYIKKTLARFDGNRTKVASHLGISERTLYRMLADGDESRD